MIMNDTPTMPETQTDEKSMREQINQKMEEFKTEVDSWFDDSADQNMDGKDWKSEFRNRRDQIESQLLRYRNDVKDAQTDAADSWSEFKVQVKDQLDMLQNRAEEMWNRATG